MGGAVKYPGPLVECTVLRRYKRFLCDLELPGGEVVTAHCPNPGSMRGSMREGAPGRALRSDNPRRKLAWSLEQVCLDGTWIMVNPPRANHVVAEAIEQGVVAELNGYQQIAREKRYGIEGSRVDLLLSTGDDKAWVEVKNVTMWEDGVGYFPDSVSKRGAKHLRELGRVAASGRRAVLFFHVGRGDAALIRPAAQIDTVYADTLAESVDAGLEVLAYQCEVRADELVLSTRLPFEVTTPAR